MGRLETPVVWKLEFSPDANKHVVIRTVRAFGRELFFEEINDRVERSSRKEALIFVHGFNTTFEDAARRTAQIAYDLAFDGVAILYSWPSQGSLSPLAYNKDGRNAQLTADRLAALLEEIVQETGVSRVHVIAHSMGTRVVSDALNALASTRKGPISKLRHVALLAPDIDAEVFRKLAQRFRATAGNVTLYASERDQALVAARLFAGYPRAGQAGEHLVIMEKIDTIDASSVDTSLLGVLHQYYADSRTVLSDLFHLIRDQPAGGRFGLRPVESPKGKYWVFAR
jgi:esterase/lipase superfamily enzyme